uniref:hypothetical protein n=1 Tax=Ornithinimicrobium sp. CNJ-824 TaxID=1904966 RepID=UPI001ED9D576|nr:hypothetical protein [Ornithinimicrobium sp. CNJ-824]
MRSLESYATYYARWSAGWESQALLRARPVAGDPDLARASPSWSSRCAGPRAGSRPRRCGRSVG